MTKRALSSHATVVMCSLFRLRLLCSAHRVRRSSSPTQGVRRSRPASIPDSMTDHVRTNLAQTRTGWMFAPDLWVWHHSGIQP